MDIELLYAGYYCGPRTFLDTYTFLKLYANGRWVFSETFDPYFDFAAFVAALESDAQFRQQVANRFREDASEAMSHSCGWFTRGKDIPAFNCGGQEVGRLADALDLWANPLDHTSWAAGPREYLWGQVVVVGLGLLEPTSHGVVLSFVPEGKKRVPCSNEMNRNVRTANAIVRDGFKKRVGESLYPLHEPASFVVGITFSPYWSIRVVTPRCHIRRW